MTAPPLLFRQLFDTGSSTYTYLLADPDSGDAVIIDAVIEQFERDNALIAELGLSLRYALDTHVHADHVTGAGLLRERLGARTVVSERAGIVCADVQVKHGDKIAFGRHELEVRETPGHTSGCLTFVLHAHALAFTGDALLVRGCGRTDFQQGDAATLYRSVHEQILSLPAHTTLYPAHDYKGRTATSVREELRWNPRLGAGRSSAEFVRIMSELKLPYPKHIDLALPANVQCGVPPEQRPSRSVELDTSWGPVALTAVGVPEVSADWLHEQDPDSLLLIDVRQPDEYRGELGHVPFAQLVPLATLPATARAFTHDRPIVLLCRSGGRSGRAALDLAKLGFARVASLRGGMREWDRRGFAVERGPAVHQVMSRQG